MPINFGNQPSEPLDFSKGGDKGTNANNVPPTNLPGLGTPAPQQPQNGVPNLPQVPGLPPRPQVPNLPQPPRPQGQPLTPPPAFPPAQPIQQQPVVPQQPVQPVQPVQQEPVNQPQQQTYQPQPEYNTPDFNPEPTYQEPVVQHTPNTPPAGNPLAATEPDKKTKRIKSMQPKKDLKQTGVKKAGGRGQVLAARVAVFTIIGGLMIAGVFSFLPKSTTLTPDDQNTITGLVERHLGISAFPSKAGEGVALAFSKDYLTYTPEMKSSDRLAILSKYVTEDLYRLISYSPASEEQLKQSNSKDASYDDSVVAEPDAEENSANTETGTGTEPGTETQTPEQQAEAASAENPTMSTDPNSRFNQTVTAGPYVIKTIMVGSGNARRGDKAWGADAIITTMTQVNGEKWIYLEIPLHYNPETGIISVSGTPTFARPDGDPEITRDFYSPDALPALSAEQELKYPTDNELAKTLKPSVASYFRWWAESNTTELQRYIKPDLTTLEAQAGLEGEYVFVTLQDFTIEFKDPNASSNSGTPDLNQRRAQAQVVWLDPDTGFVYTQQYSMIWKYTDNAWFVEDVKNLATQAGTPVEKK